MDAVSELERLLAGREAERKAAQRGEAEARAMLAAARDGREVSARRRAELVDALERADAGLQAGRDRLGPCRLSHAQAEREVERLADAAAAGSDPAVRALVRARDAAATAGEIVAAHERRCRALAAELEAAEAALAAHDRGEAELVGERLEGLMLAAAEHVDGLLRQACEGGLLVGALVDRRRGMRPVEGWRSDWLAGSLHDHLSRAALVALGPAETAFRVHGVTVARGLRSLSWAVGNLVESWCAGRGRSSAAADAEAA